MYVRLCERGHPRATPVEESAHSAQGRGPQNFLKIPDLMKTLTALHYYAEL